VYLCNRRERKKEIEKNIFLFEAMPSTLSVLCVCLYERVCGRGKGRVGVVVGEIDKP